MFGGNILRSHKHRVPTQRIAAKIAQNPVFIGSCATWSFRIRIVNVGTVRSTVAGDSQHGVSQPGFDFPHRCEQDPDPGCARLHQGRPTDMTNACHSSDPWQSIERVFLGNRKAKNASIEDRGIYGSGRQLAFHDMACKLKAMQVGETSLPTRKWRTPVGAIRNLCLIQRSASSSRIRDES